MALTYVVPAPGDFTGSILNERGGLEAQVYANDPLGRKMAAAPELVEALEAIGMLPDGFCVCPSGRDPTRPEPEHVGECRDARAALKKAGVEP